VRVSGMARVVLVALLVGGGGYLLWRALQGGGPLLYFGSAGLFGMAIGALQRASRRGRS